MIKCIHSLVGYEKKKIFLRDIVCLLRHMIQINKLQTLCIVNNVRNSHSRRKDFGENLYLMLTSRLSVERIDY